MYAFQGNSNQEVCVVLFVIRVLFKKRKSIHIYSLAFFPCFPHYALSSYKDIVAQFSCSPDMSSLSLPVLVLLTLLWGNVLAYNFNIIILVVYFSEQDLVRIYWLLQLHTSPLV